MNRITIDPSKLYRNIGLGLLGAFLIVGGFSFGPLSVTAQGVPEEILSVETAKPEDPQITVCSWKNDEKGYEEKEIKTSQLNTSGDHPDINPVPEEGCPVLQQETPGPTTISFCHIPPGNENNPNAHIDMPFESWEEAHDSGTGEHAADFIIDSPEDLARCQPIDDTNDDTVTIHTQKFVCSDPADLPNYGVGGVADMSDELLASWLANENDSCEPAEWGFQWVKDADSNTNPGDETETAGSPWSNAFYSTVVIPLESPARIWFREIFDTDYIGFTGGTNDATGDSAEFYCYNDALNFDNWDWIDAVPGEEYNCIAWNVPIEQPAEACRVEVVTEVGDEGVGNGDAVAAWIHGGWTTALNSVAAWIWDTYEVVPGNMLVDEAKTFTKDFYVDGPVNDAVLTLAADNRYWVEINGDPVISNTGEFNYAAVTGPTDVTSFVDSGWNTITLKVENIANGSTDPHANPAAGIYELVVNGEAENICEQPEEPTTTDVTICKYDEQKNTLPGWTVMLLGDYVENVGVPSNGTEVFSSALTNGDPYALIANGTYVYRPGAEGDISDSAFSKRSYSGDPINPTGQPYEPWYDVNDLPGFPGYLGIAVDGDVSGTNWSNIFNSLHTYALGYAGTGAAAGFKIWDDNYGDNSGSLNVDIYEGYVGVTGENGCVTFEDVPYGDYTLDEILQDGWTDLKGKGDEVTVDEESNDFSLINEEENNCLIEGYKYDEEGVGLEGWTIGLNTIAYIGDTFVAQDVPSTVRTTFATDETDETGYYCVTSEEKPGDQTWEAFEILQDGYAFDHVTVDGDTQSGVEDDGNVYTALSGYPDDDWVPIVNFYNTDNAGSITIDKVVVGEGANTSLLFNFDLSWLNQDTDASLTADDVPETFPGLTAGEYTITELMSAEDDWYLTGISCDGEVEHIVNLENGSVVIGLANDQDVTCTFTNTYRPGDDGGSGNDDGAVSGYKWNDLNNDGEWDDGEPGLAGWNIQLLGEGSPLASDVTDENGFYSITFSDGDYTLCEVPQNGWSQTYPDDADDCHGITIVEDQTLEDQNFGNHQDPNDGGGGDNNDDDTVSRSSSGSRRPQGEVLGEVLGATTLTPIGAPATGFGGMFKLQCSL